MRVIVFASANRRKPNFPLRVHTVPNLLQYAKIKKWIDYIQPISISTTTTTVILLCIYFVQTINVGNDFEIQ